MNYRKVNNLVGWITGAIATAVYLKTMEPTTSFWDCGEFLSCAYKVEVGHSPGAPFFMLLQRLFGMFASNGLTGGPSTNAAIMMNSMSAIVSGLTILFLFWTITHMARKLLVPGGDSARPSRYQTLLIMGAGLVGALAYTFSDTFWFSAVEAEVYATSSLFTALVFWAILKWEHVADNRYGDRWLLLIAYLIGLSVGVHLLNLLTIPAIAIVYYFKRYEATRAGTVIAFVVGCVLLGFVQFGILQGLPIFASKFDLLFVNSFHLPFDSGAITFVLLFVALLVWLLLYAKRRGWYLVHTGILCIMFIVLGFSSYLAAVIRSRADVAIDMTNPDNAISLLSYVNREQFGSQPLLTGQDFIDLPIRYDNVGSQYDRQQVDGRDAYVEVGAKIEPVFEPGVKRFFPRVFDYTEESHKRFYQEYLGLEPGERPSSADNFSFFFRYQVNWMWWRYFMWNYAGRQNDFQGQGDPKSGNWISGIKPIDKFMGRGDIDMMSDGYVNNPARNQLYFLPLILGIIGLVYQFNRDKKDGLIVLLLFFFTGLAIVLYLNNTPIQPRERDYAYAGATYAFAIWIGLGVLMVNEWFQRILKGSSGAYLAIALCLLAVPTLMAAEEWDDHDRSKKTLARATAYNTLSSCAPNAILFTFGDNDTYPLWYIQEVEGFRRDIRVINLSLLGIDWYIDQLNYRINDAMPVPMIWKKEHYAGDRRNYLRYYPAPQLNPSQYYNLQEIMQFVIDPKSQANLNPNGEPENYFPTKNFFLPPIDKAQLVAAGLISARDTAMVDNAITFTLPKEVAYKDDIAVLNIIAGIAKEGWKRPIYFGGGLPGDNYQGMEDYLRLEGVVYRLMPFKVNAPKAPGELGSLDIAKTYDLFMNKFTWGNAERSDVYYDEKNRLMFTPYRLNASRLANELSAMGRKAEAIKVLDKVVASISERSYHYDVTMYYVASAYYNAGELNKAKAITMKVVRNAENDAKWILSLDESGMASLAFDAQRDVSIINVLGQTATQHGDPATGTALQQKAQLLAQRLEGAGIPMRQ